MQYHVFSNVVREDNITVLSLAALHSARAALQIGITNAAQVANRFKMAV